MTWSNDFGEVEQIGDDSRSGIYYWVRAETGGRLFIRGPYFTEQDAYQGGNENWGDDFDVIPLRTDDPERASRLLRMMQADGGIAGDIGNYYGGNLKPIKSPFHWLDDAPGMENTVNE